MRRKTTAIVAVAILLLLGLVAALPWIVDANRYRPALEAAARQRLHRNVTLGPMRISVIPLGLRVENAVIGEDASFPTGRPFARVRELYVSPKLLPLLRGTFELRSVELRAPEIELVRSESGWNVTSLGSQDSSPSSDGPSFVLNRLAITEGQIAMTDLRPQTTKPVGEPRAVYKSIDVQLANFGPGREFDVKAGVTLPGAGAERVDVDGKAGPLVRGAVAMTPFQGTATIDEVSIAELLRYLGHAALDGTDGMLSGSAALRNQQGRVSASGALRLEETRVHKVVLGYPVEVDFDLSHDTSGNLLTVSKGVVRLDKTPISLTGTVDVGAEPPNLNVHLTASDAPLGEAARLASAFGVAFGANTQVQGRASLDVRARGQATLPALAGTVRLRNVSISGADIPQPVQTAALDVTLTPESIRSNEFSVTTAKTTVSASASLAGYTTPRPVLDARVRTSGADLGDLLNAARAWGAGAEGLSGTGRLTIDLRATGPLDSLAYSGSGSLNDATLHAPTLAEPFRVRTALLTFSRDTAALEKLAAGFGKTSLDGRVSIRNFTSPRVDFQLAADRIDVAEMQRLLSPPSAPARGAQEKSESTRPGDTVFTRTTGAGSLRVGAVTYNRLLLEDIAASVVLDHGLVRLNPVTAALYGGRHHGSIDVDARRSPATFIIASTLEKVDANQLASAVTSLKDVIYGSLGSNLRMTVSGDGPQNMARSLNGTLSLALSDGRIANVNLRREVANIARFITGEAATERSTRVAALSGKFDVKGGLARTEDLKATIEGGTLGATGTIDLADQRVDLRMTTVLSNEVSQKVGGSRVGGFMTTALANEQGELVVPLLVAGTMTNPRVAPDLQRVAEMKLKNLVPSLRNPQTLTSGILGAIRGNPNDKEGSSRSRINDIVGAVTGRQQPPAEQPKEGAAAPAESKPEAKKPEEKKDTVKEVQDALRDLLRRRKPQEKPPDPAPPQPEQ